MGWVTRDEYKYFKKVLISIAQSYDHIYSGLDINGFIISDGFWIAEYKADFDRALDYIGRGHWTGQIDDVKFKQYRGFGKWQRVVIADIYGIEDFELEDMHFKGVKHLKSIAYGQMAKLLNGELE